MPGGTILVVDDDVPIQETVTVALEDDGYRRSSTPGSAYGAAR